MATLPPRIIPESTPPSAEVRHTFVGASEAYELMNERQYGKGCVRALGYRKQKWPEDFDARDRRGLTLRGILHRGHLLEDTIAQLYMTETGRTLIRRARLVRNPEFPGAGVHTDRIIVADVYHPTGDAEIKSHGEGPFLGIMRSGLPPGHNLQLQWSLFCTGHTWGAFIILGVFGELPLKHFDVQRDNGIIEIFKREVDKFWNTLVRGELPPPPFADDDVRCKLCPWRLTCRGQETDPIELAALVAEHERGAKPLKIVHDDELDEALMTRALIQGEIDALDSDDEEDPGALQLINARIKEMLGDDEAIIVNGRWRVYSAEGSWSGIDTQRMRADEPDTYKKFLISKRPTGKRTLRVLPAKKVG